MPSSDEAGRMAPISDAQLEALLRATGARPVVPSERAERVRLAAHAVFRAQAERARRGRLAWRLALAAAVVLAVAIAIPVLQDLAPVGTHFARVARLSGEASIHRRGFLLGRTVAARTGEPVFVDSEVETAAGSLLTFAMGSGGGLRLAPGTRVRLLGARTVELESGTLYVDSEQDGRGAGPIEIRTPLGRVLEKGTQFEVRLQENAVRVRVRRGAVEMRRNGSGIDVPAGHELEIDSTGAARTRELSAFDPEWNWAGEAAPSMAIQGRTLREFLDWVARERGMRLEFADDELAASASTIVLSGSIEGLTLDQALDSVLLTSRMSRRGEDGVLRIERATAANLPR